MKSKIFAVKDIKGKYFLKNVNFVRSEDEAIRAFATEANNPESSFYTHAEDFVLYCLGEYDDETGVVSPYDAPISLISASAASVKHNQYYAARQISQAAVA